MTDITQTGAQTFNSIGEEYNNQFSSPIEDTFKSLKEQLDIYSQLNHQQKRATTQSTLPSRTDLTKEAIEAGFGDSRYDNNIFESNQLKNLNELRAQSQSGLLQIGAGILKGGVLAATTFLDGIGGTIIGALNVASNASDIANSNSPMRELGNSFINNSWSNLMQDINDAAEKALPNYYTMAEQEDPWYQHIFSANFLGDKFLKNMGFMIGAAYAGKVNAGILSKAMGLSQIRNAFKGAVTTVSGETLYSGKEIAQAYYAGNAFMDGVKLTKDLGEAAKQMRNAELMLKIAGSTSAAMGEGRIEALSNTREWINLHRQQLDDAYKKESASLEEELFMSNPELFRFIPTGNAETGLGYDRVLTLEGREILNARQKELDDRYKASLEELGNRAATMANQIFLANTLLLSTDNALQFGRFFSGGYSQGRNFLNLLKKNEAGELVANKNILIKEGIKAGINPFLEANEEMAQSFISTASGLQQAAKLNSFYGRTIDEEATEDLVNWYNAAATGLKKTYGNFDSWEEGFVGLLTGFLGMPSFKLVRNEEGRIRPKFKLEGELWQTVSDIKDMSAEQQTMIATINDALQSEDFRNYFEGTIRDRKIKSEKNSALEAGSAFDYKNAELMELVNWAIMFDKAGRLQDLYDNVDEFSNLTKEDIETVRQNTIDKETKKSLYDGMTDEQILEHFKHEGEQIKKQLDTYVRISHDLKTLYGDNISSDVLNEMVYTLTQIDDWENRFKEIFENVKKGFTENVEASKWRYFGANKNKHPYAEDVDLATMSADELLDELDSEAFKKVFEGNIKEAEKWGSGTLEQQQLHQNLLDLLNIFKGRKEFIAKYEQLSEHPELFTEEAEALRNSMIETQNKKIQESVITGAKDIKDVAGLKQYFKDRVATESTDEMLDAFISSDIADDGLKSLARKLKDIREAAKIFDDLMQTLPADATTMGATTTIGEVLSNSNSVEEVKEKIDTAISALKKVGTEQSKASAELLEKLWKQYSDMKVSERATITPGPSSPEEKIDKSGKGKNLKKGNKRGSGFVLEGADFSETLKTKDETKDEPTGEEITLESFVENLQDLSDEELENAFKKNPIKDLSEEDFKTLQKLIKDELNRRKQKFVAPEEAGESNADSNDVPTNTDNYKQILRSWVLTKYKIKELKEQNSIEKVDDPAYTDFMTLLDNLGAYDFLDRGYLGEILNRNKDTEIHYIYPKGKEYRNNVLLAIEIDSDIEKLEKRNKISTFNPVTAQDGKRYQIVGVLGAPSNYNEKVQKIKNAITEELSGLEEAPEFFVSSKTNRVKKIYSGRMILESDSAAKDEHSLTLGYISTNSRLAIWDGTKWRTSIDPEKESIVALNTNNPNERAGSVWLLTKEADGQWYAKGVRTKRFTDKEYSIIDHQDTPIMKKITELVDTIVNPEKSIIDRAGAKYALSDILYMNGVNILFNGNIVSIKTEDGVETIIDENDKGSVEDKRLLLLDALQNEDYNIRFQVSTSQTESVNSRELRNLIISEVLTTNLLLNQYEELGYQTHNVNASFDLEDVDDNGDMIETPEVPQTGHTGKLGVNNTKYKVKYHINGVEVYKDSDGNWFWENSPVQRGSKEETICNLVEEIKEGKLPALHGSIYTNVLNKSDISENSIAIKKVRGGYTVIPQDSVVEELSKAFSLREQEIRKKELEENNDKYFQKAETPDLYADEDNNGDSESTENNLLETDSGYDYPFGDNEESEGENYDDGTNQQKKGNHTFDQIQAMSKKQVEETKGKNYLYGREARPILKTDGYGVESFKKACEENGVSWEAIRDLDSLKAALNILKHCR